MTTIDKLSEQIKQCEDFVIFHWYDRKLTTTGFMGF